MKVRVRVRDAAGSPIAGALVTSYISYPLLRRKATTGRRGRVRLDLPDGTARLERLYVEPPPGFWSWAESDLPTDRTIERRLVSLGQDPTVLDHFYGQTPVTSGEEVTVGIIDSGIERGRSDLQLDGGLNLVVGEDRSDWGDNGTGHGTYVAGIIQRLSPSARLRSYRVMGAGRVDADRGTIGQAIGYAVDEACDVICVSWALQDEHPYLSAKVAEARESGSVVIAASGNASRSGLRFPVASPASHPACCGVSAMGRVGTYPPTSMDAEQECDPRGFDESDYVALCSQVGDGLDFIAPSVGVVSTVPGGLRAESGTTAAAAVVSGLAADILARRPDVLTMPREVARATLIKNLLAATSRSLGFGPMFEGVGMPGLETLP